MKYCIKCGTNIEEDITKLSDYLAIEERVLLENPDLAFEQICLVEALLKNNAQLGQAFEIAQEHKAELGIVLASIIENAQQIQTKIGVRSR